MAVIGIMSDIHFGVLSTTKEFAVSPEEHDSDVEKAVSLKNDIIRVFKEHKPNYLFIPGDLTSQALPSEFLSLSQIIDEIIRESNTTPKMLYAAGNHDTQWQISRIAENPLCTPYDHEELLALASLPFVRSFPPIDGNYKESGFPLSGIYEDDLMQVVILNSGYHSRSEELYHHGKIGNIQYEWLKSQLPLNDKKWRILLMHHHPYRLKFPTMTNDLSCLEDGDELVELIAQKGIDIIIHGHRHHPIIKTKHDNTWANPVTFICAGSFSVNSKHRSYGSIPNTFHIIELSDQKGSNRIIKTLNYEYKPASGWEISKYKDETPYDGISYYGELVEKDYLKCFLNDLFDKAIVQRESANYFDLLPYDELPPNIKCVSFIELNGMINEIVNERKMKQSGLYPDSIIIKG